MIDVFHYMFIQTKKKGFSKTEAEKKMYIKLKEKEVEMKLKFNLILTHD